MSLFTESIFAEGNTAVITGASSGIGRATALYCASVGMQVWMVDIDEEELLAAQKLVETKSEKQKVVARVVNVADAAAMEALAQEVFSTEGSCQFLMNNAGIDGGGKGALPSMELVQKVMSVNTFGPMHGCLAFLPLMKKQSSNNEALVINTGSKQGITMPPGNLTHNMSKAALKVYTEGLEHELYTERKQGLHQIHAALLVPRWVNTSIALKQMLSEGKTTEDCFFSRGQTGQGGVDAKPNCGIYAARVEQGAAAVLHYLSRQ